MKISRKPKLPVRSNPPVERSNKPAVDKDLDKRIDALVGGMDDLSQQWSTYDRVGDREYRIEKEEDVWEYYQRTTGKELERPIITVDEARDKSDKELEQLASGHDMDLDGFDKKHQGTAIRLYVTGQKKMAYKMIVNHRIRMRNDLESANDRVQSQETI